MGRSSKPKPPTGHAYSTNNYLSLPGIPLAPISLIFLGGTVVLLFFVVLSGITRISPLRQTYFLSADTSGISGARPISQWTYFRICDEDNADCSRSWPDPPVGWAWSKNPTGDRLPEHIIGSYGNGTTSQQYFYLWRFGWVFYLLASSSPSSPSSRASWLASAVWAMPLPR